jgi:lysophospholipase L1-like esterase
MNGKPKKLKDSNGKEIFPVTHSDFVYVSSNKTLTARLAEIGTGGASGSGFATTIPVEITKASDITTNTQAKLIPGRLTDLPGNLSTRQTMIVVFVYGDGSKMYRLQDLQSDTSSLPLYTGYKHYNGTSVKWDKVITDKDLFFTGKKMALLGDSIMTMIDKTVIEKRTGFVVDNLGKGGSSVALRTNVSMAPTWDPWALCNTSKLGQENSIPIENYDYAMIFIGTNDWGNSHPLGTLDSMDEKTILGAYNVAIRNFITRKPDIKLLIATPMFRTGGETPDALSNLKLSEVVSGIEDLAKKYGIPVVNMLKAGMVNDFNKSTFLVADLLHPNEVGKALLTSKFADFILSSY